MMRCAGCGQSAPDHELDSVFLREDLSEVSEERYCRACFPQHRWFDWDTWSRDTQKTTKDDDDEGPKER
jgi:hypothetical protein